MFYLQLHSYYLYPKPLCVDIMQIRLDKLRLSTCRYHLQVYRLDQIINHKFNFSRRPEGFQKQSPAVFYNTAVLKNFTRFTKKTLSSLQLFLKMTPTQMFSCEYCEFFRKTYFEEHLRMASSGVCYQTILQQVLMPLSINQPFRKCHAK